ncbi:MAG TPA: VOC family protein [Candidatus Acidoferrum sp.]|jgi:catechol 2,3-dioxygenase-like lactoylglutathione lyase family enzyme|nr:VOC family protein [Candidatus Acidoferrum sp.]
MKKIALLLAALLLCFSAVAKRKVPKRPRVLGIAGVTILVSDVTEARKFYLKLIDPTHSCEYCEAAPVPFLFLPSGQRIKFEKAPVPPPANLLAEVSFLTDDLEGFKKYFNFNKVDFNEVKKKRGGELIRLVLTDAEGHHISITDSYHLANAEDVNAGLPPTNLSNPVRIIHAGFVVNNRETADRYFVNELGFRPYWHGGMTEERDDWVAMQVPEGTDWVEYMLNISPTADKHTRGVMNHISLGVPNIHAIADQVTKAGIKLSEQPKIGRDGKWQLNIYDADDTRVEFMEFKPVQKPCCSEFTGPHPGPKP